MSDDPKPNDLSTNWPYLASSYINLCLYTLELCLAVIYLFKRHKRPQTKYMIGISIAVLVDLIGTLVICAQAYMILIIFPTQGGFPMHQIWPTGATIILNDISAAIEQSFLIHRFYTFTNKLWIAIVLCILMVSHVVFAFTSGIWISVDIAFHPSFAMTATTIANSVRVATDVCIAAALVISFHIFKLQGVYKHKGNVVEGVILQSVSLGLVAAACTTIMLTLLLLRIGAYSLFSGCIGRVYTLTMLTNLLTWKRERAIVPDSLTTDEEDNGFQPTTLEFTPEGSESSEESK